MHFIYLVSGEKKAYAKRPKTLEIRNSGEGNRDVEISKKARKITECKNFYPKKSFFNVEAVGPRGGDGIHNDIDT